MNAESNSDEPRFAKYAPELGLLLWAVWDPIGGVPVDEYDLYVPTIWKLLDEHAGTQVVASELTRIRTESIGVNGATDHAAAERLAEWWHWRCIFPKEFEANS